MSQQSRSALRTHRLLRVLVHYLECHPHSKFSPPDTHITWAQANRGQCHLPSHPTQQHTPVHAPLTESQCVGLSLHSLCLGEAPHPIARHLGSGGVSEHSPACACSPRAGRWRLKHPWGLQSSDSHGNDKPQVQGMERPCLKNKWRELKTPIVNLHAAHVRTCCTVQTKSTASEVKIGENFGRRRS